VAPKGVDTVTIYKGIMPFMLIQLAAVSLIYFIPALATWLPQVAYSP